MMYEPEPGHSSGNASHIPGGDHISGIPRYMLDCRGICHCADVLGPDSILTWRGHPSGCFRERKKTRPRRAFITVTQTGMSPLSAAGTTFSSHTRWISFCTILLFIQRNYYHAIKKTWAGVHSKLPQEVILLMCMQGVPGSDPQVSKQLS